ncbi:MAG: putative Ig domain-containing protein [Candidatus Thermoplasmatota archaeon]|nr:putative Ig domain-containing protein [Candidatus Thermoplasmatota archaeon]
MNHLAKLLPCLCLVASMGVEAATPAQIDDARAKGLAWLVKNQKGDGSWQAHGALKVQSTAAALEALMQAGMRSGETYGAAVGWLSNVDASSIDARSRKVAALALAGLDTASLAQALLAARPQTDRQTWGAYPQYAMSFPDTPLGLAALRLSGYSYTNQDTELLNAVACGVLPAQRSDGGWAHVNPAASAPDSVKGSALLPTALTLLELAAQKTAKGWTTLSCGSVNYDLATVLNNGVSFLLTRKNAADNGFGEKSVSTILDTALAYMAIQAVNPAHSALGPAQDYLLTGAGKPGADGGWGGDPLATAYALKTLPAVVLPDGDGDGIPDAVETALNNGSGTTVADGRSAAPGNGQGTAGVNSVNYDLATVLNNGVSFLLTRKNAADNGFGEKSVSTILDTALAYMAIQAVNPAHSALGPAQDYLLTGAGKPGADGGWGGDPLATAYALKTLPAVVLPDGDGDGIPDAVETALNNGSGTTVADGRSAAPGNGQGTAGVNSPLSLPAAIVGEIYTHGLALGGQSGFVLASGSLPPGLTLDANGQLAGTPTQSGTYSFQYRYDATQTRIAQLAVSEPNDGDVPVLPAWGVIALGAGLLSGLLRKRRH